MSLRDQIAVTTSLLGPELRHRKEYRHMPSSDTFRTFAQMSELSSCGRILKARFELADVHAQASQLTGPRHILFA